MPRGHAPKREAKKPKKKRDDRTEILPPPVFTDAEVEVVKKRRKPRDEEP